MNTRILVRFYLLITVLLITGPAEAQQPPKLAKIGWLFGGTAASMASQRYEIVKLLHDLGYIESKNIGFEYRYADNELDRSLLWLMNWSVSRSTCFSP